MEEKKQLNILWTNDNPVTAEKMVFMYAINSLVNGWWEKVTVIVWGATAKLICDDPAIQVLIEKALQAGVHISACKACADQLGVGSQLETLNIEVKYWGVPLTEILKADQAMLTV